MPEKERKVLNKSNIKVLVGFLLVFLSIIIMLNYGYVSRFLYWVISFVIGGVFTYVAAFILLIYGISFIVKKKITYANIKFIAIGLFIAAIGAYIAVTNAMTISGDTYLTFDNFYDTFVDSLNLTNFPYVSITGTCGIVGYLLVAILNIAFTSTGTMIFAGCLIAVGTVIALLHPILSLVRSIKSMFEASIKRKYIDQAKKEEVKPLHLIEDERNAASLKPISVKKAPVEGKPIEQVGVPPVSEPIIESVEVVPERLTKSQRRKLEKARIKREKEEAKLLIIKEKEEARRLKAEAKARKKAKKVKVKPIKEVKQAPVAVPIAQSKPKEEKVKSEVEKPKPKVWKPVPFELLTDRKSEDDSEENIAICEERVKIINETFEDMGVGATIVSYKIGPSVTRFDVKTERNFSVKGIDKIMDDVSVRLGGINARFVPIVTGKTTSGIELPNKVRSVVNFKESLTDLPKPETGKLYIPFGKNISGDHIKADFLEAPHMLVCGTTGSGKSIFMHSFILSIIMRYSPEEVRLVMVDPKRVEFGKYREMPHLLCPVISEPGEANATIVKLVDEMEERFTILEATSCSNLKQYNQYAKENNLKPLPYIVLIIDEFADLIESCKTISQPVQRLGQKARAAGIHMVIATQRPDTSVITGAIKANFNTRVALATASAVDSVTILGEGGAEKLLGNGDLLISSPLISKTEKPRVQGCFVDNTEINRVVKYLKENYPAEYDDRFVGLLDKARKEANDFGVIHPSNDEDEKYEDVKRYVMETLDYCSTSKIQGTFGFGFPRASKIFKRLVEEGILEQSTSSNNAKGAKVLVTLGRSNDSDTQSEHPGSYSQSSFKGN